MAREWFRLGAANLHGEAAIRALPGFALLMLACVATRAADPVGVIVAPAVTVDFPYRIEALGTAQANESVELTSKISEVVTAIRFEEGQDVQAGQVLVELHNAEALANVSEAKAQLADARTQHQRAKNLLEKRAVPESEVERLEAQVDAAAARLLASQARLADTVIKAPFGGRVGLRRISIGALLTPGTLITTLDDIETIKVDFAVPETHLAPMQPGLAVTARSVAYADRRFEGTVSSVDTRVDPVTRSVMIRAVVPNTERLLKPGMFLNVEVINSDRRSLVLPEQAIVPEREEQFVFVVAGNLTQKRRVVTGRRRPGEVEIVDGLREGELVVIEGVQKIDEGTVVRVLRGTAS
ncbi:MAG TPA: efflux RND transporter periplasmic adaptor subunit [Gammaproteobacteria bacterium]